MSIKVAINGFGRIGRNVLRALFESGREDIQVVAINDLAPTEHLVHLLRYDSVHGRFPGDITHDQTHIDIGKGPIAISAIRRLEDLNWTQHDIDIVMECTGLFTARDQAQKHIDAGAKRVLISAPGKMSDKTIVYGVNDSTLTANDIIISNGSCTTNALAPVAKILNDSFGIETGFMTTVHAYTGDQPPLDTVHKDLNRGRAAALSMVPTSTGATKALGLVIPDLEGKLDGKAIRVPTPNVSVVDLVVSVKTPATVDTINQALQSAATGPMQGVLQTLNDPLVSIDLNHDPHSSSAALNETVVLNAHMVRVLAWYDNEWGFSNRMLDTAAVIGQFL